MTAASPIPAQVLSIEEADDALVVNVYPCDGSCGGLARDCDCDLFRRREWNLSGPTTPVPYDLDPRALLFDAPEDAPATDPKAAAKAKKAVQRRAVSQPRKAEKKCCLCPKELSAGNRLYLENGWGDAGVGIEGSIVVCRGCYNKTKGYGKDSQLRRAEYMLKCASTVLDTVSGAACDVSAKKKKSAVEKANSFLKVALAMDFKNSGVKKRARKTQEREVKVGADSQTAKVKLAAAMELYCDKDEMDVVVVVEKQADAERDEIAKGLASFTSIFGHTLDSSALDNLPIIYVDDLHLDPAVEEAVSQQRAREGSALF